MRGLIVTFAVLAVAAATTQTTYENYKVYQVKPQTDEEAKVLLSFKRFTPEIDFWNELHAVGQSVDVMVSPNLQQLFLNNLRNHNIAFYEIISDVERLFQNERMNQRSAPKAAEGRINFVEFHRYGVIESYLKKIAEEYPEITRLRTPANTTEGRPIYMLRITTGGSQGGQHTKPAILIDGGIHAREWISPATVLYIIQELVENPENRHMIENVDWMIIPVLNPDGYEYTHTNSRLWRKNRSKGKRCTGTDLNRNFGFHWMEVGASSDECDDTFAGKAGLSEPETEAITHIVGKHGEQIKLYLTFHSYGQYLLYPWGYTSALPENWKEHDDLGHAVDKAISAVAGTSYTIGSSTNTLYAAAGGSDDWVKGVGGVPVAFCIELPGGGSWGFDPPTSMIHPVVTETWEGVKVFHKHVQTTYAN
ncbi:PREDICTED: carboxypeptidase B-like [Nicrophorus vespilloides]|uniref:Carboxypeptidase B-like n=1 Tax=Nicrophorus vespilloides TaxID=110193 RepID=A0ABM1ML15_NICVS|nr:PREDICTED: carboxypeptidase B-like [Nicrophorus vespilloides]